MPKNYQVTRRKQMHGRIYALVFTWGEGDPHIHITFKGQSTPFDTVNVYNHALDRCKITGRDAFIGEVSDWMKRTPRETVHAAAESARLKGAMR